jgi:branched-subunit amino acid aminotransferase/4-amino-4-deoxychorismate lyase
MTARAWVGDGLVPAREARVSVFDRGFRTGEGVFETIRVYGTHPFRLDAHLDRAWAGVAELGFEPPPRDRVAAALTAVVEANPELRAAGDTVARVTMTAGPVDPSTPFPGAAEGQATLVVTLQRLAVDPAVYADGVSVITVPYGRELPHVKAVSYLTASLARRSAHGAGADEALLTDGDDVLEGSASNVFAVIGDRLVTPPTDAGLLAGVTRSVVIDLAGTVGLAVHERRLPVGELIGADEVLLTATTREVVPVVAVNACEVGAGRPGPDTRALHRAYQDEVDRERSAG